MDTRMKIGELATRAGVKPTAVRFYEREGLLRGRRADNGYRSFEAADVIRVRFIRRAQELGFALAEIKGVLALSEGTTALPSAALRRLAEQKLAEIDARRADLLRLRRGLVTLLADGVRDDVPCPILCSLGHPK
jgi:MerR family transcriptional regulator, copper efflux regulator